MDRVEGTIRPNFARQAPAEESAAHEVAVEKEEGRPPAFGMDGDIRLGGGDTLPFVQDARGEMFDGRLLEEYREVRTRTDLLFDDAEHAHREQRMPAQLKEVVLNPNRRATENLLPDFRELRVQRIR